MFNYIDQLRTPSFPIGLVKTKSDFVVGSAKTSLGKWTLVVAVTSVDAYPFLAYVYVYVCFIWIWRDIAFSDLTCHLEDTGIGVFWLHCAAW